MALTKYPEGSMRELLKVALPLMVGSLSLLAMVFVDRVFLAHYSAAALSAAVTAGTASWAILGSLVILAAMAEIFVAQYNGAGLFQRLGRPVWQMLWFSLGATFVLVPLGFWGGTFLFRGSANFVLEDRYFAWLTFFGASWSVVAAAAAFWVGRGKTIMVTLFALGANCINVLLDWLLIFGVDGVIPPLGVRGAAIATSTGNMIQVVVYLIIFLKPSHRRDFGTGRFGLHLAEMRRCLKVAAPQATLFFIECMGFALFYMLISHRGAEHIYVAGAAQSVMILLFFVVEGLGRGAAAITGNMIGAGRPEGAFKVFRSGCKLIFIAFALMSLLLVFFPEPIIDLFMGDKLQALQETGYLEAGALAARADFVRHALVVSLRLVLVIVLGEGIRWLLSGILASAGDTLFLLLVGTIAVPLALLVPTYVAVDVFNYGVVAGFVMTLLYVIVVAAAFYWRFLGRRWQTRQIIQHENAAV